MIPSLALNYAFKLACISHCISIFQDVWVMCLVPVWGAWRKGVLSPVSGTVPSGYWLSELLVEFESDCKRSSHFDLLTAISFSKVPFRCFGIWERDKDKKGFCPLRSLYRIMNCAGHNLAFPFHCCSESLTTPQHLPWVLFNEMLESIYWMKDKRLVLKIPNWTRHGACP